MPSIVLLTFNARYHHAAFGLRYLQANLGPLEKSCEILEFDLEKRPADAVEAVLARQPQIVGMACYIWNTRQSAEFARMLKAVRPDVKLVIGGPEVSYETAGQEVAAAADHVLCGEADLAFGELCQLLLEGKPAAKVIQAPLPDVKRIRMPYDLYTEEDLRHRTIYVESSRGCPFSCEFCLSALDIPVRRFGTAAFLAEMQKLLDRGARQFKFVDRTFNIAIDHACAILKFFLERVHLGLFLHFEMIPDRLPEPVKQLLTQYPQGSLQLEIGVQTFNEAVAERISRKQDNARVESNFRFLRESTPAHLHADLIAGLPGETLDSFAAGFDRLLELRPHEIQLGILKRLRGAPIARHTDAFGIVYSPDAPYEILQSHLLDFATVQRLKRMARYWDLFANSGNFRDSLPLLWSGGRSAFGHFLAFSDFIYERTGKTHQIALARQFELLFERLGKTEAAGHVLAADYLRPGRRDLPGFLEPFAPRRKQNLAPETASARPERQSRHLA